MGWWILTVDQPVQQADAALDDDGGAFRRPKSFGEFRVFASGSDEFSS